MPFSVEMIEFDAQIIPCMEIINKNIIDCLKI